MSRCTPITVGEDRKEALVCMQNADDKMPTIDYDKDEVGGYVETVADALHQRHLRDVSMKGIDTRLSQPRFLGLEDRSHPDDDH